MRPRLKLDHSECHIATGSPVGLYEAERMISLFDLEILDTAPDPAFDRLTSLAAEIFAAPIAFVSFIDGSRQWFKSKQGSDLVETPRDVAFCAHTIVEDGVLVVPDATKDRRFSSNSLVCGPPFIRFYAGAPIRVDSGHAVASLCIIDTKPRKSFSRREQAILQTLADLAVQALDAHKLNLDLRTTAREAKDRYALVARATLDGVWDWDISKSSVYYSPRWQYIAGLKEAGITSQLTHWLDRVHSDDRAMVEAEMQVHLDGHSPRFRSEHRVRHGDGSWRWVVVRGLAQRSKSGQPIRMAGSLMDITKDKTSDPLTGLPNRLLLHERLERLIERSQTEQKWCFAVFFIDVDRFKQINDRFGHLVGDTTLRAVAERLKNALAVTRGTHETMVSRFAGDEFVIVVDGVENSAQAEAIAGRIHGALGQAISCEIEGVSVGVSIGIAMAKPELLTPESFLQHSDLAMYQAKSKGRGSSVVFSPAMQLDSIARLELEADLRHAISGEQLRVFYQPQVNLQTGTLVGCEALVRWQHPKLGLLQPSAFVEMAEEIGMIADVDTWVMENACRQLRKWRALPTASEISVSVNISAQSLVKRGLKETVEAVLARYSLPAKALCLELTETILMQNISVGIELMQELRSIGVGLHMDDFGSGYSSFRQLAELPFDTLKIDRSFMEKLAVSQQARNIVEGILGLAHTIGLAVVGEGIENEMQADILAGMNCEVGQGYYFAKPLEAGAFHRRYFAPRSAQNKVLTFPDDHAAA